MQQGVSLLFQQQKYCIICVRGIVRARNKLGTKMRFLTFEICDVNKSFKNQFMKHLKAYGHDQNTSFCLKRSKQKSHNEAKPLFQSEFHFYHSSAAELHPVMHVIHRLLQMVCFTRMFTERQCSVCVCVCVTVLKFPSSQKCSPAVKRPRCFSCRLWDHRCLSSFSGWLINSTLHTVNGSWGGVCDRQVLCCNPCLVFFEGGLTLVYLRKRAARASQRVPRWDTHF